MSIEITVSRDGHVMHARNTKSPFEAAAYVVDAFLKWGGYVTAQSPTSQSVFCYFAGVVDEAILSGPEAEMEPSHVAAAIWCTVCANGEFAKKVVSVSDALNIRKTAPMVDLVSAVTAKYCGYEYATMKATVSFVFGLPADFFDFLDTLPAKQRQDQLIAMADLMYEGADADEVKGIAMMPVVTSFHNKYTSRTVHRK